jgi:hypothetical protein
MRLTRACSVALGCVLAGCGGSNAPSGEQIQAALDKAVKNAHPAAAAKLTDIALESGGKAVKIKFECTNCVLEDRGGVQATVPFAKGDALVWLDPQDRSWKFMQATLINEDGAITFISSLTGRKF